MLYTLHALFTLVLIFMTYSFCSILQIRKLKLRGRVLGPSSFSKIAAGIQIQIYLNHYGGCINESYYCVWRASILSCLIPGPPAFISPQSVSSTGDRKMLMPRPTYLKDIREDVGDGYFDYAEFLRLQNIADLVFQIVLVFGG